MLQASSGWRPGIILNILQFTGHQPTRKNYSTQNVSRAKVEILWVSMSDLQLMTKFNLQAFCAPVGLCNYLWYSEC